MKHYIVAVENQHNPFRSGIQILTDDKEKVWFFTRSDSKGKDKGISFYLQASSSPDFHLGVKESDEPQTHSTVPRPCPGPVRKPKTQI